MAATLTALPLRGAPCIREGEVQEQQPSCESPVRRPARARAFPPSAGRLGGADSTEPVWRLLPRTPDTFTPGSPVVSTPTTKCKVSVFTPPPAPSMERQQREVEDDVKTALGWGSTSLLSWTLVRGRSCSCGIDHALHEAINFQHPVALEFLLTRGVKETLNVSCGGCGSSGHRPLHRAIRMTRAEGDVGYVMSRLLLEHGANPNMAGDTPLHDAASCACPAAVSLLLAYHADPNAANQNGQTPLHAVCRRMLFSSSDLQEQVVEALLACGADPSRRDGAGMLPVDYARHAEQVPLFESCTPSIVERLERAVRWRTRRTALFVRSRPESGHLLSRLPRDVFQAVVRCL